MSRLGKTQRWCLMEMAKRRDGWYPGCGWVWDNWSGTDRIMASLARRGLVERTGTGTQGYGVYSITDAGREVVK